VLRDGTVRCWGTNANGVDGDGSDQPQHTPVAVRGLDDAIAVAMFPGAGAEPPYACALRRGGTVSCWGGAEYATLGDGSTQEQHTPIAVAGLSHVVQIAAGNEHACARLDDGTIRCWGRVFRRREGDEVTPEFLPPTAIGGVDHAVEIRAGWRWSIARRADGTVLGFGYDVPGRPLEREARSFLAPARLSGL
jgi:alpha-tubulin suppressor-like RCC1 family protein